MTISHHENMCINYYVTGLYFIKRDDVTTYLLRHTRKPIEFNSLAIQLSQLTQLRTLTLKAIAQLIRGKGQGKDTQITITLNLPTDYVQVEDLSMGSGSLHEGGGHGSRDEECIAEKTPSNVTGPITIQFDLNATPEVEITEDAYV